MLADYEDYGKSLSCVSNAGLLNYSIPSGMLVMSIPLLFVKFQLTNWHMNANLEIFLVSPDNMDTCWISVYSEGQLPLNESKKPIPSVSAEIPPSWESVTSRNKISEYRQRCHKIELS